MALQGNVHVLFYKFKSDRWFWLIFAITLLLLLAMIVIAGQFEFQISRFITHPQDFPLPLNDWAIDCPDHELRNHLTQQYFWLDLIFPFFISVTLLLLLYGADTAHSDSGSRYRTFDFSLKSFGWNRMTKIAGAFLAFAIFTDLTENILLRDALISLPLGDVQPQWYAKVQNAKSLFYSVPIVLLIGSFVFTYWMDFGRLWKKFFRHFYPTIIGVGFTFLIFSFFGQAFDFIVALNDPLNLGLFLVLFIFSLIGLWMVPYYLQYTRNIVEFRNLRFKEILKYTIFPYIPKNEKDQVSPKTFEQTAIQSRFQKFKHSDASFFHKIRRSFALSFILTFLLIQLNLLSELMGLSSSLVPIILLVNIIGLGWITFYFRSAQHQDLDLIEKDGPDANILEGQRLNNKSHLYSRSKYLLPILAVNLLFVLAHLGHCASVILLDRSAASSDVSMHIVLFTIHTFFFSWSFLVYALFRKLEFVQDKLTTSISSRIYSLIRKVSFTPRLIRYFFGSSLLFFTAIISVLLFKSPILEMINPLNLFLIVLNFFVGLIAFLDRVIYASLSSKVIKLGPRSGGVIFTSMVFLLVVLNLSENHYHELERKDYTDSEQLNYLNLAEYTQQFSANQSDSTVYLIAADGGGLKAAYWTMNVLNQLHSRDTSFFNNVFLTTGASGGMVGLGMYTYMLGQGFSVDQIREKIEILGSTNFLNNDLAGLAIKAPLVSLIPPLASRISDRTKAMADRYFYLTSKTPSFHREINQKPFAHLWQLNNYTGLPLLIVNTTRTEDGSRGIVHPLKYLPGDHLMGSLTDLTDFEFENGQLANVRSLNLADGLFTTNRFPVFSPHARIEGKGHFVDGGYLENSGLSTVFHFLNYIRLEVDSTNSYGDLLKDNKIVVISIGNDRTSFVKQTFGQQDINRSGSTGPVSAILGAATGGGLKALPDYYDKLFDHFEEAEMAFAKGFEFIQIDMPFPFTISQANTVYRGQMQNCEVGATSKEKKLEILESIRDNPCFLCAEDRPYMLTPPLGRFLSDPSRTYMDDMIDHPEVQDALRQVFELN